MLYLLCVAIWERNPKSYIKKKYALKEKKMEEE